MQVRLDSYAAERALLVVLARAQYCAQPVSWLMILLPMQDNVYRLALLTHLQSNEVPLKVLECLRDFRAMYEAATVEDVYDAYSQFALDDEHIVSCIGTSGPNPPSGAHPTTEVHGQDSQQRHANSGI